MARVALDRQSGLSPVGLNVPQRGSSIDDEGPASYSASPAWDFRSRAPSVPTVSELECEPEADASRVLDRLFRGLDRSLKTE